MARKFASTKERLLLFRSRVLSLDLPVMLVQMAVTCLGVK